LIQTESGERFSIHELLRQFAAGKLAEADELRTIQTRYAAFFADFMHERRGELFTHQQFDALAQIEADFENVRSAWNVLVNQQAFDELPKFLDSLWFFFVVRTRGQEGVELFEVTANTLLSLSTSGLTELTLARVWARLAWFYNDVGLHEKAEVTAEDALRLLSRHDSPEDLLAAYRSLGVISLFRKDRETLRRVGEVGYELARKMGNGSQEAHSLLYLGIAASMFNDDLDTVLRPVRRARAIYEKLGDQWGMMESYTTEASSYFQAGDYESAKYAKERHQALAKLFGSAFHVADSALFHGVMALWEGEYGKAGKLLCQSLRTLWDAGYAHYTLAPVLFIAQLLLRENKTEATIELLAVIDRHPGHHPLFDLGPDSIGKLSEELKARLDPDRFAAAWTRGQQRELNAVVAELLDECQSTALAGARVLQRINSREI
jgi:tetratricopeptide (TPR) repeat protein